jgi:hypothetical protein
MRQKSPTTQFEVSGPESASFLPFHLDEPGAPGWSAELATGVSPEFPIASIRRERHSGARHWCERGHICVVVNYGHVLHMAFRSENLNFLLLQIAKFSFEKNIDLMCLINTLILLELSKIDYLWIACLIGGNLGILQHRFSLNERARGTRWRYTSGRVASRLMLLQISELLYYLKL